MADVKEPAMPPEPSADVERRLERPPLSGARLAAVALLGLGGLGTLFVAMWLWINTTPATGEQKTTAHLEVFKTTASVAVMLGGIGALYLAARRQRTQEAEHAHAVRTAETNRQHAERVAAATEDDAARRRVTELYTKAADQLGAEKAPVRLAGLYALERVGQDNPDQRPTIASLWCAYLRMPYTAPPDATGLSAMAAARPMGGVPRPLVHNRRRRMGIRGPIPMAATPTDSAEAVQERDVRLSVQRLLAKHLRPHPDNNGRPHHDYWPEIPDLDLTGALLINLDLNSCTLPAIRMQRTTFTGITRFDRVTFTGDVWLRGATFLDDAWFGGAMFAGAARCGGATFVSDARFSGATFGGGARFSDTTFAGDARFSGATFTGDAEFRGTTFTGDAWFRDATFTGDAWFRDATFASGVRFSGANFVGGARFSGATLVGTAEFDGAMFNRAARFSAATFASSAEFDGATFASTAWFSNVNFVRDALFNLVMFTGSARFNSTSFVGAARFSGARFISDATFSAGTFTCTSEFERAVFASAARCQEVRVWLVDGAASQSVWPLGWTCVATGTEKEPGWGAAGTGPGGSEPACGLCGCCPTVRRNARMTHIWSASSPGSVGIEVLDFR